MDTLITEKEAAKQLCLTQSTLRKWRWLGRGPSFIKIGPQENPFLFTSFWYTNIFIKLLLIDAFIDLFLLATIY